MRARLISGAVGGSRLVEVREVIRRIKSILAIPFLFGLLVFLFLHHYYVQAKRWLGKISGKLHRKVG